MGIGLLCLLAFGCGRHVDKTEHLRAGYRFKKDTVIYHEVVTWFGTKKIRHAFSDYAHGDTIGKTGYVVLVDTGTTVMPIVPPPQANKDPGLVSIEHMKYGIGSLKGEIVIYPRFFDFKHLYGPYFSGRLFVNGVECGLIHASGYLVSDIIYTHFEMDSSNRQIRGMMGDSLAAVFPIE